MTISDVDEDLDADLDVDDRSLDGTLLQTSVAVTIECTGKTKRKKINKIREKKKGRKLILRL